MKKNLFSLIALTSCLLAQRADAAVGFINENFGVGYNFFCNQLIGSPNNTANSILVSAPAGAALTEWDEGTGQYLPYSFFNGSTWSINYNLATGQGAVLYTTTSFINTFVGTVPSGTPPARPPGLYLAGSIIPITASFSDVIGRAPVTGESVSQWDRINATFNTKIFDGFGWEDPSANPVSAPSLVVMEAAFFGLGNFGEIAPPMPPPVPEPGIAALLLLCGAIFKALADWRKRLS